MAVSQPDAEALRREQEAHVREIVAGLREAKHGRAVDVHALYQANLVGGMISAFGEDLC